MYIDRQGFDGYLYKATPEQVYQYRTTDDLVTPQERASAGSFGASAGIARQRLAERGINVDAIQRVNFLIPCRVKSLRRKNDKLLCRVLAPPVSTPTSMSAKPVALHVYCRRYLNGTRHKGKLCPLSANEQCYTNSSA